ncbi:MAG: ATP-dependent DNA helicase RecG [Candidatus Hydrogenedentes bacterium]|nr:ATP-dependent DNA helicase RecG [Candidatus Hydrogenedentota bacterium]
MKSLDSPVETLSGIGPKRAVLLANLGITTVRDLLFHLPRDYQDRRRVTPIAEAREGETVTVEAEVVRARQVRLRGRMSLAVVTLRDSSGEMQATWFGRGFLAKAFVPGARGLFTGPVGKYKGPALKNPDYEMLSGDDEEDRLHTGRVVPIYRLTEKVTQRMLRRWAWNALNACAPELDEPLPERLRAKYKFPQVGQAIRTAHFPDEIDLAQKARARFAYEELLEIQLGVLGERAQRLHEEKGIRHMTNGPLLAAFRASLPYKLTSAQAHAVDDILSDLESPRPMLRLVQGDVGSGKTVVALHAIAAAADGAHQTAVMAPTEVLAEQHFLVLRGMLEPLGLWVELLTGSMRGAAAARRRILRGEAHVVVGTHALIQEKVEFKRLGLVIIDEQHRFGVYQRSELAAKGTNPDVLHMTATPIPRTLAITVYGGMDVTVIDEMPPGRLPVKTRRIPADKIPDLYNYIVERAHEHLQTYYVCPLVEESDKRELAAVTTHFHELSAGPFSGIRTALMHGRLDPDEKDRIMREFKQGLVDVLFSTTVIEVGVDVPNATTMVIEDAAQFGLTQLHQLRGRVGRGNVQSYCFLLGMPKTEDGARRLDIMCKTSSGFEIAEEDLKLRGPGEFYGVRQAGLSDLRAADLIRDVRLLDHARRDAQDILKRDPALAQPQHALLAQRAARFRQRIK